MNRKQRDSLIAQLPVHLDLIRPDSITRKGDTVQLSIHADWGCNDPADDMVDLTFSLIDGRWVVTNCDR
jgi:hypothetical protein